MLIEFHKSNDWDRFNITNAYKSIWHWSDLILNIIYGVCVLWSLMFTWCICLKSEIIRFTHLRKMHVMLFQCVLLQGREYKRWTQWKCFDFDLDFFLGCLKFVFAFHQRKSGLLEEKSCSCKSNIFYFTYLAVSCLAHTRLGEWFIFVRLAWSIGWLRSSLLAGPFHE